MFAADGFSFTVDFEEGDRYEANEFGRECGGVNEDVQNARNEHFRSGGSDAMLEGTEARCESVEAEGQGGPEYIFFVFEVAEEGDFADARKPRDVARAGTVITLAREESDRCADDSGGNVGLFWHFAQDFCRAATRNFGRLLLETEQQAGITYPTSMQDLD